ncbi:MAG TPA: hypothetical protein PLZ51_23945, partial [Aggregatilineales bacterium]|nr:hypothetical protein [Aggregatilineales bacterium]
YVILQLGDLSRFNHTTFERAVVERLVNVEILVESPEDIAPYVAGAISILHSADGDMFEFMRTMTIISQLPPITGEVLSAGISASVYGYFANFVNDSASALEAINAA